MRVEDEEIINEDNEEVNCCENPRQKINNLEEENSKLMEEVKMLNDKLIEYTNYINHMKFSIDLITEKTKLDIFKQDIERII